MMNLSKKGNNVERWEQKQRNRGRKYQMHPLYRVSPSGEILPPSYSHTGKIVFTTFWK